MNQNRCYLMIHNMLAEIATKVEGMTPEILKSWLKEEVGFTEKEVESFRVEQFF